MLDSPLAQGLVIPKTMKLNGTLQLAVIQEFAVCKANRVSSGKEEWPGRKAEEKAPEAAGKNLKHWASLSLAGVGQVWTRDHGQSECSLEKVTQETIEQQHRAIPVLERKISEVGGKITGGEGILRSRPEEEGAEKTKHEIPIVGHGGRETMERWVTDVREGKGWRGWEDPFEGVAFLGGQEEEEGESDEQSQRQREEESSSGEEENCHEEGLPEVTVQNEGERGKILAEREPPVWIRKDWQWEQKFGAGCFLEWNALQRKVG